MLKTYFTQLTLFWRYQWGRFWRAAPANLPPNVLITLPHASYRVPLGVFAKLSTTYKLNPRLLMNYSDFGTKFLVANVPENQKVLARFSRLLGDPNRSQQAPDLLRFEDFGGEQIFSSRFKKRLTESWFKRFWLKKILRHAYHPFFAEIVEKLEKMVERLEKTEAAKENHAEEMEETDGLPQSAIKQEIIVIDLHDTGNWLLGSRKSKDRRRPESKKMPKVVISNAPDLQQQDGSAGTADLDLVLRLKSLIVEHFGYLESDIKINEPFLGGNVIRQVASHPKIKKIEQKRGVKVMGIQLEFARGLYMNERTQTPNPRKMAWVQDTLIKVLGELKD